MARTSRTFGVALALALAATAPPASAQDDDPSPPEAPAAAGGDEAGAHGGAPADLPAVEAPPELDPGARAKARRAIERLRNSHAGRRAETQAEVIAFGRGALPLLLDAAGTDHAGKRDGLVACLVALADARDRDLVERALQDERVVLRRFAAIEAGELGLPRLLDRLVPRLADDDPDVAVEAALSLARRGREEGLDRLVAAHAGERRAQVLAALPGLSGRGDHAALAARLALDPELERRDAAAAARGRVAVVELLAAIGDDAALSALARALDDPHNLVQRAAIDAVRAQVEQAPPLEAGSIFEQIREVERLKALLGRR